MTQDLTPQAKRRMKDIYHFSPVLWAVIKGAKTPEEVAESLGKPLVGVTLGLREAMHCGLIAQDLAGRLMPGYETHLRIRRQYEGKVPFSGRANNPVHKALRAFKSREQHYSTQQVADELGRPYNSVYKTLRRLEQSHLVRRVGKFWQLM